MAAADNIFLCSQSTPETHKSMLRVFEKTPGPRYRGAMNDFPKALDGITGAQFRAAREKVLITDHAGKRRPISEVALAQNIMASLYRERYLGNTTVTQQDINRLCQGGLKQSTKRLVVAIYLGLWPESDADKVKIDRGLSRGDLIEIFDLVPFNEEGGMTRAHSTLRDQRPSNFSPKSYALRIVTDHMVPELHPGDVVWADPARAHQLGRKHVFTTPDEVVRIFELVGKTAAAWQVRDVGSRAEITLLRKEWPHCHRIVRIDSP